MSVAESTLTGADLQANVVQQDSQTVPDGSVLRAERAGAIHRDA